MPITEFLAGSGWFDSHCHLNEIPELTAKLQVAVKNQINTFVIPGTYPEQWQEILPMRAENVHIAVGTHPWFVAQPTSELAALKKCLEKNRPIAIGEIGLDFYQGRQRRPSKTTQIEAFEMQLSVAKDYGLPVILHSVKAHNDVLRILKRMGITNGVVHAFSGSTEMAQSFVDQGFHLGIGPTILKSAKTLNAIVDMPIERLLLETDAPFMATKPIGSDNPLLDLVLVAEKLAAHLGMSLAELRMQTRLNSLRFFGLTDAS